MQPIDVIYVEDDEQEAFVFTLGMRVQQVTIHHISQLDTHEINTLLSPPYDTMHVVLFDAMLAGVSGVELAAALRDAGDTRPVFLITAGENPDPQRLANLDISYVRKPVDFAGFASTLRNHLA